MLMRLLYSFNLCHKNHKQTFKNEKWFEEKWSTINIAVMLGINVTGHQKLKSLVVESSQNATSFKGTQSLGVKYAFNRKYRMDTKIYEKMCSKYWRGYKMALIVYNCSAHLKKINQKLKKHKSFLLAP